MFRCLLLIAAFLVAACERPAPVSSGTWVGGFELSGEQVATEPGIWLDFDGGRARVGEADAWTSVLHLERRGDVLHFEVVFNGAVHVFDARRGSSDVIEGVVACGDTVGVFRFDRLAPYDATEFAQQVQGTYVTASRSLLVTSEPSMGRLFDIDSGATHALHPLADGTYLVGPGFATAFPRAGLLRAKRDAGGRVISLTLDTDGKHETGHLRDPAMQHVRFSSQGAELAGTVLLAEGAASRPGVVFVHGSGRITRDDWWQQAMARVFLRDGFDVLLYDKRGVGESGGEYVGRGAKNQNNVSPENLELLAMDAKAAVATLAARPGVDPKRVGLFGISQAGWIIPLAASASDRVAFVAEVSGPAVSTFLEDVYSKLLAEDGGRPSHLTPDEAETVLTWAPTTTGFDPAPALSRLRVPALFVYGGRDTSIPPRASARVLGRLEQDHDFEVVTLANAGHEMLVVGRDTDVERRRSPGFAGEGLLALRQWLKAHVREP